MFLIALGSQRLAIWDSGERRKKAREVTSKGYFTVKFSRGAGHYEDDERIEHARPTLYWQMDAQDLVFAKREASSTR
jgi:hypothetical protein